jgi:sulfonate transport system ATP-binding protein
VQEAVALGERIVLIDEGKISFDAAIALQRPRLRTAEGFAALEEQVLSRVLRHGALPS